MNNGFIYGNEGSKMSFKQSAKKTSTAIKNKRNQFVHNEIYRQLRTNIEYSIFEKKIQVVNMVSTFPAEGKSSVASNLAMVCVAKYKNVLLIDCDLRRPVLHRIFNVTNKIGLSDLIHDFDSFNVDDDEYFQKFKDGTSEGKLYVLTSGTKVPNPSELVSSDRFAKLIELLKTRFDFIIIDCPPAALVADAIPVSNLSDGTIFIISAKDTDKNEAKNLLQELQRDGANVIGSVMTKTEASSKHYYDYYADAKK